LRRLTPRTSAPARAVLCTSAMSTQRVMVGLAAVLLCMQACFDASGERTGSEKSALAAPVPCDVHAAGGCGAAGPAGSTSGLASGSTTTAATGVGGSGIGGEVTLTGGYGGGGASGGNGGLGGAGGDVGGSGVGADDGNGSSAGGSNAGGSGTGGEATGGAGVGGGGGCDGTCGDGCCEGAETTCNCADCGIDPSDGCCSADENSCVAPDECGTVCGDGCCNGIESASDCIEDCGDICGDGWCGSFEEGETCPEDCTPFCGDGECNDGETTSTCPGDCPTTCGDGYCHEQLEDACGCPSDCSPVCGDECCSGDETSADCPCDCPLQCGDAYCNGDATLCAEGEENSCNCSDDCGSECGDGCCNGNESNDPASPDFCGCDCEEEEPEVTYNMCALPFLCTNGDGSGCGGYGGACEDCINGCAECPCDSCSDGGCCTLADLEPCLGGGDDECPCSEAMQSGGGDEPGDEEPMLLGGGEEVLTLVAEVSLSSDSTSIVGRLWASMAAEGAPARWVVVKGTEVSRPIGNALLNFLPQEARTVIATAEVISEMEAAHATAITAASRAGIKCFRFLKWAGKGLRGVSIITGVFLLLEVSAKAGEYLPPLVLPNTVARIGEGGLRDRCMQFHDWYKALWTGNAQPGAPGVTCKQCVERSIASAPKCDSSANDRCTWCSAFATNQDKAYSDLKTGVENINAYFAERCGGKPGGYFTKKNTGWPGLWARIVQAGGWWVNLENAICPY
jgi:hypothetical protein